MKTYIITISRRFPATHALSGKETCFISKILDKEKIHTIRSNYPLWKKRFEKINRGEACLSLRYWVGKPYRSKQQEFMRLTRANGVGLQRVQFAGEVTLFDGLGYIAKNGEITTRLAANDGLTPQEFKEWFKGYDPGKEMAIIHFTKFRY